MKTTHIAAASGPTASTAPLHHMSRVSPMAAHVALAFAFTWLASVPLIAAEQGRLDLPGRPYIDYLPLAGSMLAALSVTARSYGWSGVASLLRRLLPWRSRPHWLLIGALTPLAFFLAAAAFVRIGGSAWPDFSQCGRTDGLPAFGLLATGLVMTLAALGEEVGWRGFALPWLQRGRTALRATLLLTLIWAGWRSLPFGTAPTVWRWLQKWPRGPSSPSSAW